MSSSLRVAVVMPVFDDWAAASIVCQQLDYALRSLEPVVATAANAQALYVDGAPALVRLKRGSYTKG